MTCKTALITGGAIRIGKDICKKLHERLAKFKSKYSLKKEEEFR